MGVGVADASGSEAGVSAAAAEDDDVGAADACFPAASSEAGVGSTLPSSTEVDGSGTSRI